LSGNNAVGANANGGAIYNHGTLSLFNCTLSGNSAAGTNGVAGATGKNGDNGSNGCNGGAGGNGYGGAIYNSGTLSLFNCTLANNSATGGAGGIGGGGGNGSYNGGNGGNGGTGGVACGGAVYNGGTLSLSNCAFSGNVSTGGNGGGGGTNGAGAFPGLTGSGGAGGAGSGAGVYSAQGSPVVNGCTFSGNTAHSGNGEKGGTLSSGNGANGTRGADSSGGGMYCLGGLLTNCTFYQNTVAGGIGGDGGDGTANAGNGGNGGNGAGGNLYSSGTIRVVNCTFASGGAVGGTNGIAGSGAFAGSNGSMGKSQGGGIANVSGTFTLRNSIIATNYPGTNAYGTITDGGYNISSDASINFSGTSTKNTDPKLGPLAYNGGPTNILTMALPTNSPAINKISAANAPLFDERGVPRPVGAKSDIGAFELGYLVSGQVTADTDTGGLSNVLVTAVNGSTTNSTTTDDNGNFAFYVFPGKTVVTPYLADYQFAPASITNVMTGDLTNVIFTAEQAFVVSGQIIETNNGLSGVSVTVGTNTVVTGANGNYAVSLPPGTYTITPSRACYRFNPAIHTVTVVDSDTTGLNFIAGRLANSTISGWITNAPVGTSVQVTNSSGSYTTNNTVSGNWNYAFSVCPGTYAVTPSKPGYQFSPDVIPITVGPDTNGVDFTAWAVFTVSGRVTNGLGVSVTMDGPGGAVMVTADAQGKYTNSLPAGIYTITPSNTCYHFNPPDRVISVGSNTNVNFAAILDAYTISGQVTTNGTTAFSGVTVSAGGKSAKTGANGNYTLTNFCAGDYTVTASFPGYQFPPQAATVGPANASGVNFAAISCNYTISGKITEGTNGLSGVAVQLFDTLNETNATMVGTDVNGNYALAGLCPGIYLVTPSLPGYVFDPAAPTITVGPSTNGVSFTATRFRIGAITLSANGTIQISVLTNPGATTYWLEASTNLVDWESIFTNPMPFQFTDTMTIFPVRFYRAVVQ